MLYKETFAARKQLFIAILHSDDKIYYSEQQAI